MNRLIVATLTLPMGLVTACTGGERNLEGCPADEVCSDLTPNGMHFTGVSLVGIPLLAEPKTTAIGGTQTIELWKELDGGQIVPLDLPFAAMADNGDAIEIVSAAPNAVVVGGIGAGADLLRITEADSDLLYDRYEISAEALDRIMLVPSTLETFDDREAVAFYQGDFEIGLALLAASGTRLADDSLSLTVTGPQPTRSAWDTFAFSDQGPGTVSGTLTAAGRSGPFALAVVDAVDQILPLSDSFPDLITPGSSGEVCFRATAGDAGNVIGLPWSFSATGPVTATISLSPNCFALQVNAAGAFTVTATALGVSTSIEFSTGSAAAWMLPRTRVAPRPAARPSPGEVRGERARAAE